jgi:uncharacterized protein YhaN
VRIDRIWIDGFGRLRDFDSGSTGLERLVVAYGPNEAGKSTLFTFLTTALYGFLPAARERNPQVPWGADEAAGRIRLRLDGGGCAEIERRLRSQPTGRLTLDGTTTDLRNQALPWVEHVPRTVFRQVFAVTLGDLAGLDSETWARIQDKVVGTMGASDLRSARAVAEALEREAGETWRPNRRGNQRLRDLQADARALRARRGAAFERDATVRALVAEGEQLRERLQRAREQRQRDRLAVERAQSLVPIQRQSERIAALRRQGGDPAMLAGLPPDPPARLAELEVEGTRLRKRIEALDDVLSERRAVVAAFDEAARRLIAARADVSRLVARAVACAAERARAVELDTELGGLEQELDGLSASILDKPWREVPAADVDSLPIELLRDLAARARLTPSPPRRSAPPPTRPGPMAATLLVGLALLGWGGLQGNLFAAATGAGLAAVALTLLVAARRAARTRADAVAPAPPREVARGEVRSALEHLPIRSEQLDRPGEQLVGGLARLRQLLRDRAQRGRALEAAHGRVHEIDQEAARLVESLGLDVATNDLEHTAEMRAHRLDLEVRRAEGLQLAAAAAEREARRLAEERAGLEATLRALEPEQAALRAAGDALAPGDSGAGLREARARIVAHRRADDLREEFERAHPDLHDLGRREAGGAADDAQTLDHEQLATTRARIEALEEEIENLLKRSETLARDAAHLRELETVDAVDGELASSNEQSAHLERERDRKWVLAKLLREADRRFREEHQPDLLRRAGSYLRHLTGGRYERLVVDERDGADLFKVVGPGLPAPVALAPPVSTGTLEQAYLSLRLAIVDHLDQGAELLPLFIDEVFVNWDQERRARGLEVMARISEQRQVFVFTCHEGLAAELETRGARLLILGGA